MTQGTPINVLVCPKCGAPMRAYERNGITVDQCTECRGIFLDRGELEHLMGAEQQFYDQGAKRSRDDDDDDDDDDDRRYQQQPKKKKKKMSSFLEGLFEGE
jgi:hypothetical protein